MSKFFSTTNSNGGTNSIIDDENISTMTTFSSYEVNQLLIELANRLGGYSFKEYPAGIRVNPQNIFETPNSDNAIMWVLREGVKMTLNIDYVITDSSHIQFKEDILPKYTVSVLIIGNSDLIPIGSNTGMVMHTQNTPSATWKVKHELKFKYPHITLVDKNDSKIEGDIHYDDEDNCTISFCVPVEGKCILNI